MRERGKEVANPFPFIGVVAKILFGYGGLNILGMGPNFWGGVAKKNWEMAIILHKMQDDKSPK